MPGNKWSISAVYPRCLRLGLIEANPPPASLLPVPPIRGVYASASLKHPVNARDARIDTKPIRGVYASASLKRPGTRPPFPNTIRYPRCLRLGLIEAYHWGRRVPYRRRYPRCLRLGLIEASGRPPETECYVAAIRGVYASASLKLDRYRSGIHHASAIRGVYASASLKQRARQSKRGCVATLSEVFTPRPH